MLLKQLISAASQNFQCNNMHGAESDNAIELEDDNESNDADGIDKDEIAFNKIKQFAQDMKNENDDDIEDFDHYEEKASKEDLEEVKAIESKDNNSTESYASKKEEITAKRHQEIDTHNKTMMRKTLALLECNSLNDLSELALSALSSLDNIERGSLKADKKVKSFLGRWFEKHAMKKKEESNDKGGSEALIERDRMIFCDAEILIVNEETKKKEKKEMKIKHRALSVRTKRYNKWFMTSDKQPWNQFMKKEDLKKHRCSVRMTIDSAFEGYEDVELNSDDWPSKQVCKVISGLEIANVHNEMFNY